MRATLLFILITFNYLAQSQNLVVDGAPVLLPRLTKIQRDAITGQSGMMIFNSTDRKFQGFVGGGDPIVSSPPAAGMPYNLANYLIVFTPNQSGILQNIELYTESAGLNGSLQITLLEPCQESNVIATSNTVNTIAGWNTYTLSTPLMITNGTTYYIGTNSGTVNASLSQANNPLLEALFWNGASTCTPQGSEIAVRINLQGTWVDLH